MARIRDRIVAHARSKIGVKWKHQGRTDFGLDCVGLVVACSKHLNLTQFDFFRYSARPQSRKFVQAFYDAGCSPIKPFSLTKLRPGDIVVLSYGKYPMHCGICAVREGIPTLIHSSAVGRRCREEDLVIPLSDQVFGGFRYPGVD
jgi:cell wall-associated NlpC family hydrolase